MVAFSIFQGVEDKVDKIVPSRDDPPNEKQIDTFLTYLLALELGLGTFAVILQIPAVMMFGTSERSRGKDAIGVASLCTMIGLILILSLQQWLMLVIRNSNLTRQWKTVCRFVMVSFHGALCFIFLFCGMLAFVNACEFSTSTNQTNSYQFLNQFKGLIFGAWLVSLLVYICICLVSLFVGVASLYLLLEFCNDKTTTSCPIMPTLGKSNTYKIQCEEDV